MKQPEEERCCNTNRNPISNENGGSVEEIGKAVVVKLVEGPMDHRKSYHQKIGARPMVARGLRLKKNRE
jgi:hypothetical protein